MDSDLDYPTSSPAMVQIPLLKRFQSSGTDDEASPGKKDKNPSRGKPRKSLSEFYRGDG
jgi:hypothetical protein